MKSYDFLKIEKSTLRVFLLASFTFLLTGCQGVEFPTVEQMLINLTYSFPGIWELMTAGAYLSGIGFMMRGVYQLKAYGDMRTMMSSSASIKGPLSMFAIGAALLYSPTTFQSIMMTTFGYADAEVISYGGSSDVMNSATAVAILQLIQLIGLIAFIRGWYILAAAGNPGKQASVGKALTHIIGGVFAINIEGTRDVFMATFGITYS